MLSIPVSNTVIAQQQGMMTECNCLAKPVDGYNLPQGHLNAVRHNFDDPSLRVEHFCKPHDRVMMVCQLYDSNSANATLIGIEYMITQERSRLHFQTEKSHTGTLTGKSSDQKEQTR